MRSRLELHHKLTEILGHKNVYYQPPETFKMVYPCIIYNQEPGDVKRANNKIYSYIKKYTVTCIINNENDEIILRMLNLINNCTLDNTFVADNLYHYTFTLYY